MGTWGTGLYAGDFAADLKADFAMFARVPGSPGELVRRLIERYDTSARDPSDESYTEFWLILADRMHLHGLEHRETFSKAVAIVAREQDIEMKRELGMSPADLRKRKAILLDLENRLKRPHPNPRKIRPLTEPEPHAFPEWTIIAYPTDHGEIRSSCDPSNAIGFEADGWGSAVILANGHLHGYFAWSAIARLSVHGKGKPTIARCLEASIENQPSYLDLKGDRTLAVQTDRLPPLHARRMGIEALGRVKIDPERFQKKIKSDLEPTRVPVATASSVFTWWSKTVTPKFTAVLDDVAIPSPAVALKEICA